MSLDSTPAGVSRQPSTPPTTPTRKPLKKPRPDFPLSIHKGTGYWCKKVRGRVHYFGKVADDPKGKAALETWLDQKDDLLAGREPRPKSEAAGLVVGELCNQFLAHKEAMRDNGELSPRTFLDYHGTCEQVVKVFRRDRLVSDLVSEDFRQLRTHLAKTRGLVALRNVIQRVRTLFKFAFDEGLILAPIRYGQGFQRPKLDRIDAEREVHRAEHGAQMFEAEEIRLILKALDGQEVTIQVRQTGKKSKELTFKLKKNPGLLAMVMLAANCAFGQSDLAGLTTAAVNLKTGWVNYGRSKTGVARKIPLWPETVQAIRDWIPVRPEPKDKADAHLLFLTRRGARFLRLNADGYHIDGIGQEFQKVIKKLGLHRPRLGLYALRHGFETIAGDDGDQVAVDAIMGHKDRAMAAHYRERIKPERLVRAVEAVRNWALGEVVYEKK